MSFIKSPMNYTGGKYKLLKDIIPLFPDNIGVFVDLFAGGLDVSLNVKADKIICNDILTPIINLYKALQNAPLDDTMERIDRKIAEYELSKTNREGYYKLREEYNITRDPVLVMTLISFSFNNMTRFNKLGGFNAPFGVNIKYLTQNMRANLKRLIQRIQNGGIFFQSCSFEDFDFTGVDFVYCDPPYLIAGAAYNAQWKEKQEVKLLEILSSLDNQGVKFGLSNVLEHKGKTNEILKEWIKRNPSLNVRHLKKDYSNSTYHASRGSSDEVFIRNYE